MVLIMHNLYFNICFIQDGTKLQLHLGQHVQMWRSDEQICVQLRLHNAHASLPSSQSCQDPHCEDIYVSVMRPSKIHNKFPFSISISFNLHVNGKFPLLSKYLQFS
jgi:hypothetical protein